VQSTDAIKVITVRTTGFDPAAASGGSAAVESLAGRGRQRQLSSFLGSEIAKSDRPELTSGQGHRQRRPRAGQQRAVHRAC
jgi:electron transfer flavoprotein alpha subunit